MYLFLITFLSLYGFMHCYAFIRLRCVFQLQRSARWLLVIWMIAMTTIPVFVRAAEYFQKEKIASALAWPGYIWMGFIFIFTSTLFFADLMQLIYRGMSYFIYKRTLKSASPRFFYRTALILAICLSIYAFIEAGLIRSEHVVLHSSKLPTTVAKIRIVQISDVHIGLLLQDSRFQQIIEQINNAKPDILIATGDLVDGKLNRDDTISARDPLATLLAAISAPSGKFAVVGNHEVYAGLPQSVAFTQAAGFTVLRNKSTLLANGITITGIDDQAVTGKKHADKMVENALLTSIPHDSFHLLLKHRPDILPESDGRFDLQLSGHVHGGQIFPFNFLVRLKHKIPCGTTTTAAGSSIHVSRGTGTWGPPMRLFAPPEITVIDVVR